MWKCARLSWTFNSPRPKPREPPSRFQFWLWHRPSQPQMGVGLRPCLPIPCPTPTTVVCLPVSRLGPSLISLRNDQDFREGRAILWMGTWWTRTCRLNSPFWSPRLQANKTFTPRQQNHLSLFCTQEHAQSTGLVASAPKKLSVPSAFLSLSSMKQQTRELQFPAVRYW